MIPKAILAVMEVEICFVILLFFSLQENNTAPTPKWLQSLKFTLNVKFCFCCFCRIKHKQEFVIHYRFQSRNDMRFRGGLQ